MDNWPLTILSLFADDTDLYLEPSEECISSVINELTLFGKHSGCRANISKTKCIPLGSTKSNDTLISGLANRYGPSFMDNSFTALGINFNNGSSIQDLCKDNYENKIAKAQSWINTWGRRDLSLIGKCTIIKSLILSQFTYLIIPLPTPSETLIKTIDTLIFHFLWGCKRDKLNRDVVTRTRTHGGLDLFMPRDFIISLKVTLINKLISKSFQHKWKDIVTQQLTYPEHVAISIENGLARRKCHFTQNLLDCYTEWKTRTAASSSSTMDHCIWANCNITDIGAKLWNQSLMDIGVIYLSNFISDDGSVMQMTYDQFIRKWDLAPWDLSPT